MSACRSSPGAKLAGAGRIVAVDRDPGKLALARARGATDTLEAAGDVRAAAAELVPAGSTTRSRRSAAATRSGSHGICCARAARRRSSASPRRASRCRCLRSICSNEKTLRGCYYGSADVAAELPGLVRLAAAGDIDLAGVVSHVTDLDGVEEALQRLRRGEGARTIVILDAELAGRGVD